MSAPTNDMSRFDHQLLGMLESPKPPTSLVGAVREISGEHPPQIAIETVISADMHPMDRIQEFALMTAVGDRVKAIVVHDERGDFLVTCWPTRHNGVYHLSTSIPTTDPRSDRLRRWIANSSPSALPCFLNHDEFSFIGTSLSNHGPVEVSRLTARRRSDWSSVTRGWKARAGSLRPSHQEAIQEAELDGAAVRTMTLHVDRVLDVHVRRTAGATFYSGNFRTFGTVVMARLADAASSRRSLLNNRARKVSERPMLPIAIKLAAQTFTNRESTGELVKELIKRRNLAVAVMHKNPYLHVVVTNYDDGSNFDVFITKPDIIEILPGYRASLSALTELAQWLSDRFEAEEIAEASPLPPVSLDELLSA